MWQTCSFSERPQNKILRCAVSLVFDTNKPWMKNMNLVAPFLRWLQRNSKPRPPTPSPFGFPKSGDNDKVLQS